MPATGTAVFHIVAGDRIDRPADLERFERAETPIAPGLYLEEATDTAHPTVPDVVHTVGMEVFPGPDTVAQGMRWVEGSPAALVELPEDQTFAGRPMLADFAGQLFEVASIEQLPAIPEGKAEVLHRPPTGAAVYDIVLVSEGYATADEPEFLATARRLSESFLGIDPYHACTDKLRITALFLPSPESGISESKCDGAEHPDKKCPATTKTRKTLFGTRNNVEKICRLIAGSEERVRTALNTQQVLKELSKNGVSPKLAVVVANTRLYGGAGAADVGKSPLVVWTAPTAMGGAVMAHEMGHALGLQDEYEAAGTGLPNSKNWVNISDQKDPSHTPWNCFPRDKDGSVPTCAHHDPHCVCDPHLIGTFEGAGHAKEGRFRPTKDCAMRTPGGLFCAICAAQITNRLSGITEPLCPPH